MHLSIWSLQIFSGPVWRYVEDIIQRLCKRLHAVIKVLRSSVKFIISDTITLISTKMIHSIIFLVARYATHTPLCLSVGRSLRLSVHPSDSPSVTLYFSGFFAVFGLTTPAKVTSNAATAHPQVTGVAVYPALVQLQSTLTDFRGLKNYICYK